MENGDVLLREAKEETVVVAEAMIDSHLKTICVVSRRANQREVIRRIAREIWRGCIRAKEALHRRKDQRRGNLETGSPERLVLLLLGIHRQRIAGTVTTKFVPDEIVSDLPC